MFLRTSSGKKKNNPPVFSVPSGNFGNICAGLMAHAGGLPVNHFIAACNVNDAVPAYLQTGKYKAKIATPTISNAMDVGSPSNFIRVLEIFQNNYKTISEKISGYTVTDEQTKQTIADVYNQTGYITDPHGAVAYHALHEYLNKHSGQKGIFLETAHPVKFPETVEAVIEKKIQVPESAQELFGREKHSVKMDASFEDLKQWLMEK